MKKYLLFIISLMMVIGLSGCLGGQSANSKGQNKSGQNVGLYPAYEMKGLVKKWGYINEKGEFVIKPQYDSAELFLKNGLAKVSKGEYFGMLNASGSFVIEPVYRSLESYDNGDFIASKDYKEYCVLNKEGKSIFQNEGYIGDFRNELAVYSKRVNEEKSIYGYIDRNGKVVIPAKYEDAKNFENNAALVKIEKGKYGILNNKGELIKELNYAYVGDLSEGAMTFSISDSYGNINGYLSQDGSRLIDEDYTSGSEFKNGLAIVSLGKEETKYGVIDKKGKFIIPPAYGSIQEIGGNLYAASKYGDEAYSIDYAKKAIFSSSGKQLTGFNYYSIQYIDKGFITVSDDTKTYLIDEKGIKNSFIKGFNGVGDITKANELIMAKIDGDLHYLDMKGKEIWNSNNTIDLENGFKINEMRFRPDRCMLVNYPEIHGFSNADIEKTVNEKLKKEFLGDAQGSELEEGVYGADTSVGYSVQRNKDLLIITLDGYYYPIGAAHGQPYKDEFHINVKTGSFYNIDDLFKKNSSYRSRLIKMVESEIDKSNKEEDYEVYFDSDEKLELGSFVINKDYLCIYYAPYAIAPYVAGFPEFEIPYKDIMDIIDTEGELWNSFDKDINWDPVVANAVKVTPEEKASIKELMESYENGIVEGINNNNFSVVEPFLLKDGSLYKSQKDLIERLNNQGIKEQLESYSIDKITMNNNETVYYVYVTENVTIQYPDKAPITKQFKWIYSVVDSYETHKYLLTNIEKLNEN